MTTLIRLDDEIVATVGATRFHLSPRIEALPSDDPTARIVVLMCAYALKVAAGEASGPYLDADARGFAYAALADI